MEKTILLITTVTIAAVGMLGYIMIHDGSIIVSNHEENINYLLSNKSCDDLTEYFLYDRYLDAKDLILKSTTDQIIVEQVEAKIAECGSSKK